MPKPGSSQIPKEIGYNPGKDSNNRGLTEISNDLSKMSDAMTMNINSKINRHESTTNIIHKLSFVLNFKNETGDTVTVPIMTGSQNCTFNPIDALYKVVMMTHELNNNLLDALTTEIAEKFNTEDADINLVFFYMFTVSYRTLKSDYDRREYMVKYDFDLLRNDSICVNVET